MKVMIVTFTDAGGGAARAAYRLFGALRAAGFDAWMKVRVKQSADAGVSGPAGPMGRAAVKLRIAAGRALLHLQRGTSRDDRSANLIPSHWAREINDGDADVVNLHWLGLDTLSIWDIGRIRKPIVWTLHDMWAFCGAEHIATDWGPSARWQAGYQAGNRPEGERGLDIDRFVWQQKRRAWRSALSFVAPSRWLAGCASASRLLAGRPCATVPNVLDTSLFAPVARDAARRALGIEREQAVVLFGAREARDDPRKGVDLLRAALRDLRRSLGANAPFSCLAFGQAEARSADPDIRWLGRIDDARLAMLYSAADVMVVPSRVDNLPQTATEAQACGCPVVAFATGGLPDAVEDRVTGYLARPFDVADLAQGVRWVLADPERHAGLRRQARERALRLWSAEAVVPRYAELFAAAASARSQ